MSRRLDPPILLAASVVVANYIGGDTIHRFFNNARAENSGEQPDCDLVKMASRLREIASHGEQPFFFCSLMYTI